jgi:hypothetical protein
MTFRLRTVVTRDSVAKQVTSWTQIAAVNKLLDQIYLRSRPEYHANRVAEVGTGSHSCARMLDTSMHTLAHYGVSMTYFCIMCALPDFISLCLMVPSQLSQHGLQHGMSSMANGYRKMPRVSIRIDGLS